VSCNGRGICGCGEPRCVENAWWFHFCGVWLVIAFEMIEARDAMIDAEIDFAREQQQEMHE
jgi:hypothetical protein